MLNAFLKAFGFAKEKVNVLVVGLDNSGKTTLINHLKCKKTKVNEVVPTVGFSVEEFSRHNLSFCVFDMSGQGRYRSLWESYYRDAHAIIYVLDCTDKLRMTVARDELNSLLEHGDIKNKCIPVLFFANKVRPRGTPRTSAEVLITYLLFIYLFIHDYGSILPSTL